MSDKRAVLGYVGLFVGMLVIMAAMLVAGLYGCPSRAQTQAKEDANLMDTWNSSVQARELTMSGCRYLVVCAKIHGTGGGIDVEVLHEPNCPNHAKEAP